MELISKAFERWVLFMVLLALWTAFYTQWFIPTFLPGFGVGMVVYLAGVPGCIYLARRVIGCT